jgi:hypothetical protein
MNRVSGESRRAATLAPDGSALAASVPSGSRTGNTFAARSPGFFGTLILAWADPCWICRAKADVSELRFFSSQHTVYQLEDATERSDASSVFPREAEIMDRLHHHRIRLGILAGTLAGSVVMAVGVPAAYAAVNCVVGPGVTQTATTVTGTNGNDTIDCGGVNRGKRIIGKAGNDTITGTRFHDTINGGRGNDTMTGGRGHDTLIGGRGHDTMTGSAGRDTLKDGLGNDTLTGSAGNDRLKGGAGDDTLSGGVGKDGLNGGVGTDILNGDAGNDTLKGPSNDLSVDTLNGGAGSDTCQGPGPDGDTLTACNP